MANCIQPHAHSMDMINKAYTLIL